jgi:tryptophan halogenase
VLFRSTAIFIKRNWPTVNITVVEDPKRPPIIAGESGTTTFVSLLRHLKIDINDFIRKVNATPKVGGHFKGWNGEGTEFIHSLQTDYAPWLDGWTDYHASDSVDLKLGNLQNIMSAERNKDTYLKTLIGNDIPLADAFYATYFIKENKVPFGAESDIPCVPMWHFESRGAAAYFKELGLSRGIDLIEGEYQHSKLDENGNITSIVLNDLQDIDGDWFFDCSGFSRLLVGKVYNEKLVDYTDYFPARAVVAWWDEPKYVPTTNATAMKYGWSWNINLRHRSGNGYIYDPDYLTLDQAVEEASTFFKKEITPIANFQFTPGMFRNAWHNNTVAIGLSSGFLEPLEANGVAVIIESLYALQDYWKPFEKSMSSESIKRFNDRVWYITEDIRDFLSLHYRGQRRDTEFWVSHANDSNRIPDSLKHKLQDWKLFYEGITPEPECHGYSSAAWLMVLQGLKVFDHSVLADKMKAQLPIGKHVLNTNIVRYNELVAQFWTIDEWIQRTT